MSKAKKTVFRIFFTSQGKGYELYARNVNQGDMYGFVEISEIVFGERSRIVVDPGEESLKNEFGNVRRLLIPYHAVIRIDEVEKEGPGKVFMINASGGEGSGPGPVLPPQGSPRK
jgi:hypothetical protein